MSILAKSDADTVRVHNRHAVIDHLRHVGIATRKELSAATGLSVSAASAIASGLLRAGLVRETDEREEEGEASVARRGRPGRALCLHGAVARVAAARIGVGEIAVRICDYRGAVIGAAEWKGDIGDLERDDIVARLAELYRHALASADRTTGEGRSSVRAVRPARVERFVVAVQGKTDSAATGIVWSPALKRRDLDIAGPLSQVCGAPVAVHNDCSLMPEAFRWSPDFKGRDFAILFIGFGVGMGLRLGGVAFQGQRSSAVEFGHINHIPGGALCRCGNRGCIEAYAADYAIWRKANGEGDRIPASRVTDDEIERLARLAREGDAKARDAFAEAGSAIGYGLGRMFTLVDPLPVVFTGAGAHAMDLMEAEIRAGIAASAIDGDGADVAFSFGEDVDEMIFSAATTRALGTVDDAFARSGTQLSSARPRGPLKAAGADRAA